jgi:hypothetical protein
MNARQLLATTIKNVATYYGRNLEPEVLSMMCDDLADLPIDQVVAGYNQYRRNPKNRTFPLPSQIRELVNPEEFVSVEAQAREIASRIVGAVTKFGWNNAKEAQVYIGPVGWNAVSRQGGWMNLCQNMGASINPTTFQAQLRDQLEGSIRYGEAAIEQNIFKLPESNKNKGLQSFGEIMKLIGKSDDPQDAG